VKRLVFLIFSQITDIKVIDVREKRVSMKGPEVEGKRGVERVVCLTSLCVVSQGLLSIRGM
jgi:hypothetical protein